jgi:Uma2 family endonuclease
MQEYLKNGTRLGWLINRQSNQVAIYHHGQAVGVIENPSRLSRETVLQQFSLDLALI